MGAKSLITTFSLFLLALQFGDSRTIIFFFCGWGDNTLISNLNRMFYSGGKGNTLKEAFKILSKTVKNPYECYLLLDNHPNSPFKSSMKLRSNIFDKENPYFLVTDEI